MMNPLIADVKTILLRDLAQLGKEISAFEQESLLWETRGSISNSAGNLCLHICGNLRHFIGHGIGGSGYVRDRDAEFAMKLVPRSELLEKISLASNETDDALNRMNAELLLLPFPYWKGGQEVTYAYLLLHIQSHLAYHLGQVNYLRRSLS